MRLVPLAAAAAASLGTAPSLAAPPTAPSDLRADVYSGTAAELFWNRSSDPDGFVRGYEIRRDGQLVDTRDGLSYFTEGLSDGRAFAFTVTAVDFDGERSAPASVSVVSGDRGGAVGSGAERPPPPANLRSEVYSSSAAEVFWDRVPGSNLSYEVRLDGDTVTTTNGTSAFLPGLDGARGRGVDVVAIAPDGRRSGAANVTLGGGAGGGEPPSGGGGSEVPAPSSLRGELYSGNAGEVFWDRVPGADLTYEVRLDGETVATTNGTSYFVGNRPGLDGTSVEVVAIGPDGTRSNASGTTLGDGGTSSPDPGAGAPPAPANARLERYSNTAAELFWTRPDGVVTTRVLRDGVEVASNDATSYFDADREPGREYAYTLVSRAPDGRESAPVTLGESETSAPPTAGPRLRRITNDFATGGPSDSEALELKAVSEDGRYVFLVSRAVDLVPFASGVNAVYRHDVTANRLDLIVRLDDQRQRVTDFDASSDGDAIVYRYGGSTWFAEASDGFGPRLLGDVLPGDGRVTSATLADDGTVLGFNGYRYETGSRVLERVSKETAPSSSSAENALDWQLGSAPASISDDGAVLIYRGEAEPSLLDESTGFEFDPATFVYDASIDVTRVIGRYVWRLACGSCPPLGGARAGQIVSGDGSTAFLPTLPPEDFGRVDPDADVSRYDVVSGRLETLDGLRGADQLATDSAGRVLAYRLGGTQRVRLFDTGEDFLLTDSGFSSCGRVCLDGQTLGRGSLVSPDGRFVTFYEYTGESNLATGAGTVRARVRDLEAGTTRDALEGAEPADGFSPERVIDVRASADGRTVAYEVDGEEDGAGDQVWVVRAADGP